MIVGLDKLINDHTRLGICELNLCIVNGDLVRPHPHTFIFKKMLMLLLDVFLTTKLKKLEVNGLGFF